MQHIYIDGSKFEANANKYTFVWKKGTEKSRYRLYEKITKLFDEINAELSFDGLKIETNTEYTPEQLELITASYANVTKLDPAKFVHGRGSWKTPSQRYYEKLVLHIKAERIHTENKDLWTGQK